MLRELGCNSPRRRVRSDALRISFELACIIHSRAVLHAARPSEAGVTENQKESSLVATSVL